MQISPPTGGPSDVKVEWSPEQQTFVLVPRADSFLAFLPTEAERQRIDLSELGVYWMPLEGGTSRMRALYRGSKRGTDLQLLTELATQLAYYAWNCLDATGPALSKSLSQLPRHYGVIAWSAVSAFRAAIKSARSTGCQHVDWKFPCYTAAHSSEEPSLKGIRLPQPSRSHFLIVLRICMPADSSLQLLVISPFEQPGNPERHVAALPEDLNLASNIGHTRQQAGRCSHCDQAASKLYTCAGCQANSYCGKECQRSAWKAHRPWCKRMQSWQDSAGLIRKLKRTSA